MDEIFTYAIGFLAQVMFFTRTITQWFKSEQERRVFTPLLFWRISLIGSILLLIYGILRNDAAIVLGQFLVYYIYIRNIHLKGAWFSMNFLLRILIAFTPALTLIWFILGGHYTLDTIINNEDVSKPLMLSGILGQLVYYSRYFYQWIYSENHHESSLPKGFWIISICGSSVIFIYALIRIDPVLVAAHSLGMFVYIRNILLFRKKSGIFDKIKSPLIRKNLEKFSEKIN